MKAYELHPIEGFGSLTVVDRPEPGPLGPHDVRVRVRAVSLNFRDLNIAKAAVKRSKRVVPTSDGAGEVVEVGAKVTRVKVGERVAAAFFPTWTAGAFREEFHAAALGGSIDGMLAEQVVHDEAAWVKLPAGYSFEQGATLPCAAVTAWNALFGVTTTGPGDQVLVQGTGGVSLFALQLAHAAGARVIATSSSDAKRERLTSLGAAATIDYKANPAWGDAVKAAAGGRGVDVAVEVGGAGTFDQSAKALAFGGTVSLIGVLAGTQAPINTFALIQKSAHVHGIYVGSVAMFERLVRAIELHRIEPIIDRTFAFGEARAAYEHLASGAHFGKIVVAID